MVVAITALVVACSGTAVAAGVLITSPNQLRNGVVTGAKVRDGAITGAKLAGGAVTGHNVVDHQISTAKLTRDAVAALQSSGSTAYEYVRKSGPDSVAKGDTRRLITADNVPAGVYAIFAKTIITDQDGSANLLSPGQSADGRCDLGAGGDIDEGTTLIGTAYGNGPSVLYTQITHTFSGPGTITLTCTAGSSWRASDTTVIAVRLGNATRSLLNG